ncbi:28568_t:CDS:2, partial [Gigaspora margarita]
MCDDKEITSCKHTIKVIELSIHITIICSNYGTQINYNNETNGIDFLKAIAAAGLVEGMNREKIRTIHSLIGLIRQNGIKQYFDNQDLFMAELIEIANKNAEQNLRKYILEASFDCSWSYVREAIQASGEFVFNGIIENCSHKPIIAFHIVEKLREYKNKNEKTIIINKGNYNSTITHTANSDTKSPMDKELFDMQTKTIINYLRDKHDKYWPEDLVPYGQIVQQSLETMQFHPSFATKISNFKTIIKCGGCQSFSIRYSNDKDKPDSKNRMLDAIVSKVFNFTEFRPKQRESIDSFTTGNDTLCILPTGRVKTFIYASLALLFTGLTVVFTPLKALMGDQMQKLVNIGILSAMLYASSEQSSDIQE